MTRNGLASDDPVLSIPESVASLEFQMFDFSTLIFFNLMPTKNDLLIIIAIFTFTIRIVKGTATTPNVLRL